MMDASFFAQLARHTAAIRSAEKALAASQSRPEPCMECADQAIQLTRQARDALAVFLVDQFGVEPVALICADGSVLSYSECSDGLGIVPSQNVFWVHARKEG
jgi:hypothetical protein